MKMENRIGRSDTVKVASGIRWIQMLKVRNASDVQIRNLDKTATARSEPVDTASGKDIGPKRKAHRNRIFVYCIL